MPAAAYRLLIGNLTQLAEWHRTARAQLAYYRDEDGGFAHEKKD